MSKLNFEHRAYLAHPNVPGQLPQIQRRGRVYPGAILDLIKKTPVFEPYRSKLETVLDDGWGTMLDIVTLGGVIGSNGRFKIGLTADLEEYLEDRPFEVTTQLNYRRDELPFAEIFTPNEIICILAESADKTLFSDRNSYSDYDYSPRFRVGHRSPSYRLDTAFKNMFKTLFRENGCPELVAPQAAVATQIHAFEDHT